MLLDKELFVIEVEEVEEDAEVSFDSAVKFVDEELFVLVVLSLELELVVAVLSVVA